MIRLLLSCCAIGLLSAPASASDGDINLHGAWSFQAEVQEGCSFTGIAHLKKTPSPGLYLCEMTANDYCPSYGQQTVRQSCLATVNDEGILISSEIEEFLNRDSPEANYKPDNFLLTATDGKTLEGTLDSAGNWKAKWVRTMGGTS